jgi:CBS domain containing-hemolysin-like protein
MNGTSAHPFQRAMSSSALFGVARRVIAGSAVCTALAVVVRGLRRNRRRIVAGLGGEWSRERELRTTERLEALVADSWVVSALSSAVAAPSAAPREARARRLLDPILSQDLPARVRILGCVIVIAVLTHTLLLELLGVAVPAGGWGIRAGLVASSLLVAWRPGALAAAWRDRTAHREMEHRA